MSINNYQPHGTFETHRRGRYRNHYRTDHHGLKEFLRWQRQSKGRFARPQAFPVHPTPVSRLQHPHDTGQLVWIGHASFLFQYKGFNILTDPVFAERVSPVSWLGPRRTTPLPFNKEDLPEIDWVLISHNHYDHLDKDTVLFLSQRRQGRRLRFFVPAGLAGWFRSLGIESVVELPWWASYALGDVQVHGVPAQHFSGRTLTDRNRTHWCGWVVEFSDFRFYFAGDTGYSPDFKAIGKRFQGFDLSLIPIGAYEPRWFMKSMHVDPFDAVCIHQDVQSRLSVGMHWGTFVLTEEPMDEPPRKLQQALEEKSIDPAHFRTLQHGEIMSMESVQEIRSPSV